VSGHAHEEIVQVRLRVQDPGIAEDRAMAGIAFG